MSHARSRREHQPLTGDAVLGKARSAAGKCDGWSLLELVLCMAIVAVAAAVAVPRYGRASAQHQVDLAARRVAADLRMAQSCARAASSSCTVEFLPASNLYRLLNIPSLDGAPGSYSVSLAAAPYRTDLALADFGGDLQITFDGWGLPDTGGSTVVRTGGLQRTIIVDAQTGWVDIQ